MYCVELINLFTKVSCVTSLLYYKIKSEIFVTRSLGLYEGSIGSSCGKYIACGPAARRVGTCYGLYSLLTRLFRYRTIKGTFYFRLYFSWQLRYCSPIIILFVKSTPWIEWSRWYLKEFIVISIRYIFTWSIYLKLIIKCQF